MLNRKDKIAIVACSNPLNKSESQLVVKLKNTLDSMEFSVILSDYIFVEKAYCNEVAAEKGRELNSFFKDSTVKAVFDISGGDIANTVLDYIDFNLIKNNPKMFWGYSDLTTILNAIYTQAEGISYLYQIKNLVRNEALQKKRFEDSVLLNKKDLFDINWNFIQGKKIDGVVVGGNLRCFLKLASTPYFPDLADKVLFLESLGGGAERIATYFNQLKQMGVFSKISGLLLGTFTELEKQQEMSEIIKLITGIVDNQYLPIAKTQEIGHSNNSKCLIIGNHYSINNDKNQIFF